jgi:hypothetical protein
MARLEPISYNDIKYIPIGVYEDYQISKLLKDKPILIVTEESTKLGDEDAAAVATTFASIGYNPFTDSDDAAAKIENPEVSTEAGARNATGSNKLTGARNAISQGVNAIKQGAAKAKEELSEGGDSVKRNASGFLNDPKTQKAIAQGKQMAAKVQDFAKSSVAKVNALPEQTQAKMINSAISEAKEEPKSMVDTLKKFALKAGKAVGVAGLAITALPVAAAAVVADKTINAKNKQNAAEELDHEITRINAQIQKADQEGDYDKKADLLIAKRTAMQAQAKLKYGLKRRMQKVIE